MLIPTAHLLQEARRGGYAVGAFNVYTLEGVRAVIAAAEACHSPVILQFLPKALEMGGTPLIGLCLEAGRAAVVPVAVHLDHSTSETVIRTALSAGVSSIMADGSHLPYDDNLSFTSRMVALARENDAAVEAELGRLSGSEDGLTVDEVQARLTDPEAATDFVEQTSVDALAVCIGNVHGAYSRPPDLDFDRLRAIGRRVTIPLVLHGTSGLPDAMIRRAIPLGVSKFNVNTELRSACIHATRTYLDTAPRPELVTLMAASIDRMKTAVISKIALFGSSGKG